MHAVVMDGYGDEDVLRWAEVPDPVPAAGEVVVAVRAAGVNRADLLQRQGHYPPPPGTSELLGMECAGEVVACGEGVEGVAVGDRVGALLAGGGYAELVAVPAGQLLPAPPDMDLVLLAALPEVACTVHANLGLSARLAAGELLLVHGGSSGIGTFAIQYARALGARVAVTAGSDEKLARCAELGADILINYRSEDFVSQVREATDGAGANVILDIMGASYLSRNVEVLAADGRLVIIGLQGGTTAELKLGALLPKRGTIITSTLRARPAAAKAAICASVLDTVWPMITAGTVAPVVDRVVPMPEAATAHRLVKESTHIGKVLLEVPR